MIIVPEEFETGQKITIKRAFIYSTIDGFKYFIAFILICITYSALVGSTLPIFAEKVCPLLK